MARAAKRQNSINTSNFFPSIFIIAFLFVGFIPNLDAVDKIAPQWLYLSIVNFLCGLFLYINRRNFLEQFSVVLSSLIGLTYIFFVVWGAFSYFYAINSTEVLVNIVRQLNTLLMFLHLGVLLYNIKEKNHLLSFVIAVILGIEVFAVLEQAIEMFRSGSIKPGDLKGVTANRNITAFSIAIKIPFIIYLILKSKGSISKLLYSTLIFCSLLSVSLIQSRASYIAVFLIGFLTLIYSIYNFIHRKKIKELFINFFYVVPFFLALFLNQILLSDKGVSAIDRATTLGRGVSDNSINQRFRYYQDVFTQIGETPIFGVGLGNWKLRSIHHDRFDIDGYIVPYHAHSDFIQLGAELGILGFILYIGIFIFAAYFSFILLFKSDLDYFNKWFILILITALGVYFIDANLNFPIARPQVLAPWALIISLISFHFYKFKSGSKGLNYKFFKPFPLLTMVLMIFSITITYKTYQSHKGQLTLLRDFNTNKFSIPLDRVETITPNLPNITVTTIPMESIKARYFINLKKYDKALELLNKGSKANPYLFYSENQKAQVFLNLGKIDSALVYSKKAFYGLPKNALHASTYAQILGLKKDTKGLIKAFDLLNEKSGPIIWKNFLVILSQNLPSKDPDFVKYATKAVELFPNDEEFFALKKLATISQSRINEAANISKKGLDFFNRNNFIEAAIEFENASKIDFLEYAHYENAASAYFMAGDYQNALDLSQKVIDEFNIKTGKSEYINGLVKLNTNLPTQGCKMLKKAIELGYTQAQNIFNQRCK